MYHFRLFMTNDKALGILNKDYCKPVVDWNAQKYIHVALAEGNVTIKDMIIVFNHNIAHNDAFHFVSDKFANLPGLKSSIGLRGAGFIHMNRNSSGMKWLLEGKSISLENFDNHTAHPSDSVLFEELRSLFEEDALKVEPELKYSSETDFNM